VALSISPALSHTIFFRKKSHFGYELENCAIAFCLLKAIVHLLH